MIRFGDSYWMILDQRHSEGAGAVSRGASGDGRVSALYGIR
jgi:hypothetical protein